MTTFGNRPWVDGGFAGGTRLTAGRCETYQAYKAAGGTLSPKEWQAERDRQAFNRTRQPIEPPINTGGRTAFREPIRELTADQANDLED